MYRLVGIRVDAAKHPQIPCAVPPAPIQVEPPGVAVQFDPSPGFGCDLENLGQVDGVRLALEKKTTGRVTRAC